MVVVLDAQKLIRYSDQHMHKRMVIAPADTWAEHGRKRLFDFLAPPTVTERHVEMPIVSFNEFDVEYREPLL